jgi:predicted Zn-dependent protease
MTLRIFALMLALLIIQSCATVPVTGRRQLSLVSNSEIIAESAAQYKQVLNESKLGTDAQQVEMVKRVGNKIKVAVESYMQTKGLASQLEGFNWEFNVIQDDKTVNAWCMPGGKVAFYTAILPICKDEDGVAVVMGHEVAHAIANHGRERMSQSMLQNGLLTSLGAAMGQNPSQTSQLLLQAVGAGTNIGLLKFSRDDESEADHIGLIFLAMAGYDPTTAPKFWERMSALSGGQQPLEFLSTHPSHETRIRDLQGWIPEALSYKK